MTQSHLSMNIAKNLTSTEFSASTILYKATTSTQMSLLPLWVSVSAQTTLH
nr:MAG TPA: hypothetical protein [Caudoviricetes sp.]